MDIFKHLNRKTNCSCGRKHEFNLERLIITENALFEVPLFINNRGFKRVLVIQDINTKKAAGESLNGILSEAGFIAVSTEGFAETDDSVCCFSTITLTVKDLLPDEYGIGSIVTYMPPGCDLMLAVGSGTINDLVRFISYKFRIPYVIIATAPSMDGFTSNVAAMVTAQAKTTYFAHVPLAVIGDLNILAEAPDKLIAAGVGDILGKYVCLADWMLAHLIVGEYYCPEVAALVRESIVKVREVVSKLAEKKDAVSVLMEALVLSGIAMTYVGNSRPASGSEHQLAHYWEMQFLRNGEHAALHGTMVGVGTIVTLDLYQRLLDLEPDFNVLRKYSFDAEEWERNIVVAYGAAAPAVIALEAECKKNSPAAVIARLERLSGCWPEVKNIIAALPKASDIKELLNSLNAPTQPSEIGISDKVLEDSIKYAKEIRNRYGLLQILYDLQIRTRL